MINQLENNKTYLGFTNDKTSLQAGKIEKCLDVVFRYSDGIMARKDAMLLGLRKGKLPVIAEEHCGEKVKKSYRLEWDNFFNEITKTEYDFCVYLVENDLVTEEKVNEYINRENEEHEKVAEAERVASEEARIAKEKAEKERADFRKWLQEKARNYHYSTWMDIQEKIFLSLYGEFAYPERAYELLVCIENIDKPLCREELKARLHTDNKASRKTFMCVTGLKLPNTNKETMEFLDILQVSNYAGTKEFKERKKPEEKEIMKENFFILEGSYTSGYQYKQILGELIKEHDIEFFIHKTPDNKIGISSVECGLKIVTGNTKTEAIKALKRIINEKGNETVKKCINDAVVKFGKSPYKTDINKGGNVA